MPHNPWQALEAIPGLTALRPVWEKHLRESFPAFRALCLRPSPALAPSIPCPRQCGCYHTVIHRHDGTGAIAICRCSPPACPDIPVTTEEITPLEVHLHTLGHAISKALGCQPKIADLKLLYTLQFASWSSESVPAILTVQSDPFMFHSVIADLGLRLRRSFILFAPTPAHMDADCQELLANVQAGFFPLDSTVTLSPSGTLTPCRPPNDLLARFTPKSELRTQMAGTRSTASQTKYALRKHHGVWQLIFDGEEAFLKHERGLLYVVWLLYHPEETPIHAIDLMAKIPELYRQQLGLPSLVDPSTGKVAVLPSTARLQERSLALDDRESVRALYKKQKELDAILDSDDATEPEKAEALRELEAIAQFQRTHARRSKDSAQRSADALKKSIRRTYLRLSTALTPDGTPHPVLRHFASHLQKYIIAPSRRPQTHPSQGLAATLTYQPPTNVAWRP